MWNKAEYAATGRGHLLSGMPCQDRTMTYRGRAAVVAALADGAGSASLSQYGAEAAVRFVSRQLGDYFDEYYWEADASAVKDRLMCGLWEMLDVVRMELGCRMISAGADFDFAVRGALENCRQMRALRDELDGSDRQDH